MADNTERISDKELDAYHEQLAALEQLLSAGTDDLRVQAIEAARPLVESQGPIWFQNAYEALSQYRAHDPQRELPDGFPKDLARAVVAMDEYRDAMVQNVMQDSSLGALWDHDRAAIGESIMVRGAILGAIGQAGRPVDQQ